MTRLRRLVSHRPGLVLAAVALLTGLLGLGLVDVRTGAPRLVINSAADTLLPSEGPEWELYERARLQFGSDKPILVALGADDVFAPEVLGAVRRLTEQLGRVPGVQNVVSLSTAQTVRSVAGDIEVGPFFEEVPRSQEALAALRRDVLGNPIYAGTLAAHDGRTVAMLVQLERMSGRELVEKGIALEVERVAREGAGDLQVWVTGSPYVETLISGTIRRELALIIPLTMGLLGITLFAGFRTLRGVMLPLLTIGVAQIWTLGTLGWLDQEITLVTSIVPPLIQTIGFSYAMHVVADYYAAFDAASAGDLDSPGAVDHALGDVGVPVFVTGLTTAAGFLSLTASPLDSIREFGLFSLLGVGCTVLASLSFTPAALALLPTPKRLPERASLGWLDRFADRLGGLAMRRRGMIIAGGVAVLVIALVGMSRIRVATEFIANFDEASDIRRGAEAINQRLGGANEIQILLESDASDVFLAPVNLRHLEALQDWLREQPEIGEATSIVDYVKMLHQALQDDPEAFTIPESKRMTTQLFFFGASRETDRLVDARNRFAKVHVRARTSESARVAELVERIEARLAELPEHIRGHVSGSLVLLNRSIDEVARGQWTSLLIAFVAIYAVLALLFTSLRMGLRALFPNFLPIAVYFGALGITGVTLNPWTSLVAPLALGIAVDDTIHYFARFNADAKRLADERRATVSALRSLIRPVTFTTVGLCLGFSALIVSDLQSQREFGLLAAFTLGVAWLTDVTLTPALCAGARIVTLWDVLSLDLGSEPQRSIPLFEGLNVRQARVFALMSHIRHMAAGETLFRENDKGREMYVILDGTLRSSLERDGGRIELARMTRGDTFGEIGLFSELRTAQVDAETDARVIAFDPDDLERLRRRYPRIAARVFLNLNRLQAERLVRTTRRVR